VPKGTYFIALCEKSMRTHIKTVPIEPFGARKSTSTLIPVNEDHIVLTGL
jgi:hypothetical protein